MHRWWRRTFCLLFGWGGGGQQPNRPARSRPLHYRVRPLGGATALPAPCGAAAPAPGTERPPAPLQWGGVFIVGVSWLMAPWEGYRAPKSGAALPLLLPPVGIVAVLALPFDAAVIGLGMLSPSAGWAHPKVAPSIPRTARCFSAVSPPVLLDHPPVPVCHSPFPFCHPLIPLCHPPTPTCPPPPPSPCATLSLPSDTQTLGDTHLPGPEGPPPDAPTQVGRRAFCWLCSCSLRPFGALPVARTAQRDTPAAPPPIGSQPDAPLELHAEGPPGGTAGIGMGHRGGQRSPSTSYVHISLLPLLFFFISPPPLSLSSCSLISC